jgi:hypothetical protein
MSISSSVVAAVLLHLSVLVSAHGHHGGMDDMDVGNGSKPEHGPTSTEEVTYYAGLSSHAGLMMAHIGLMVLAWFFVLPLGKCAVRETWSIRD